MVDRSPKPKSARATLDGELSLRERKHQRMRQVILDEAALLFRERGYSSTTLKDIAGAAETSIATIIRYFTSKNAILLHRERLVVSELARRIHAHAYQTLKEGVLDVVETSFLGLPERVRLYDVIMTDPECMPLLASMRGEWESVLEDLFAQFLLDTPEGRLRAKSLAYMLTASGIAGVVFWYQDDKRHALGTMQQALIEDFIAAFVAPIDLARRGEG